jgi:uncharacterized membrane protein
MEPKRSKYDTNPLDENVAHRADESFGRNGAGAATEDISGPTRPINRTAPQTARAATENEAPTRRMDDKVTAYPSVFVPPPPRVSTTYESPRLAPADIYQPPPGSPPNIYQAPGMPLPVRPGLNRVEGLGMAERWALIIPYIPAWLGIVGGFIELLLVPRSEARVRFHAAQGIVLQLGMTALTLLLAGLGLITSRWSGVSLFRSACFIFLIVAMVKVWKGKPFVIAPLEEPRRWLEEKIKPRK